MSEELSDEQLLELQNQLESLSDNIEQQLGSFDEASKPVKLDQQSTGRLTRMDAIQQQEMAKANQTQLRQRLQRVHNALLSFVEGDYGYCRDCDEAIVFARLQANPETPFCLACQSKLEQK